MCYPVPSPPSPLLRPGRARTGTQAQWATVWQRAHGVLVGLLVEAGRYACGCPRSRLHQRAALRELDGRLLRDIGVGQGGMGGDGPGAPGIRLEGHRWMATPAMYGAAPDAIEVRRLAAADSIPDLTRLLHRAYARLAAMGLRYMATHQSDEVTRERVGQGECYVAVTGGVLVGTIMFKPADKTGGSPWLDRPDVASLAQFAVDPGLQAHGLGARLMDMVEARAAETGAEEIALDTAEPAAHLVAWYARRGYRLIEHAQWDHTNYRSVIMSKRIGRGGGA